MSATSAEARTILSTAHHGTHRPLLAWAIGVEYCRHAMHPRAYWHTRQAKALAAAEYAGQTLNRGRMLTIAGPRIEVTGPDLPTPLRLTWQDVAAVLAAGRITSDLVAGCAAAMHARAAHPGHRAPGWFAIEDACYAAGEAVWVACKPTDPGEQLDLFAALGGVA